MSDSAYTGGERRARSGLALLGRRIAAYLLDILILFGVLAPVGQLILWLLDAAPPRSGPRFRLRAAAPHRDAGASGAHNARPQGSRSAAGDGRHAPDPQYRLRSHDFLAQGLNGQGHYVEYRWLSRSNQPSGVTSAIRRLPSIPRHRHWRSRRYSFDASLAACLHEYQSKYRYFRHVDLPIRPRSAAKRRQMQQSVGPQPKTIVYRLIAVLRLGAGGFRVAHAGAPPVRRHQLRLYAFGCDPKHNRADRHDVVSITDTLPSNDAIAWLKCATPLLSYTHSVPRSVPCGGAVTAAPPRCGVPERTA